MVVFYSFLFAHVYCSVANAMAQGMMTHTVTSSFTPQSINVVIAPMRKNDNAWITLKRGM